ncbi:MAG: hypothetical protein HFE93_04930 [Acutalibacter muris]|jgi:hypothetical protein|nr:hypothetical protein [Acutalibacter muris]
MKITNTTPTGLSRRELWVDARDIQSGEGEGALSPEEYAQALETRGREKLAECQLVQSFTAQVRTQDPTFEYGRDYKLGDRITVSDRRLAVTVGAIVTAAEYTVSREGRGLSLTLGYSQPTVYEKLARKEDK